jgi:hypothetical protein
VVPYYAETSDLLTCLTPYHIPVLQTGAVESWGTTAEYAAGDLYAPALIANDRVGWDVGLWNQAGYFDPGSKVGIFMVDDGTGTDQKLVSKYWEPALSTLHVPVVSTFTYPQITGFSSIGNEAQEMNNAVLQFRSAGVNHVLFAPQTSQAWYFFSKDADSQGYHPREALDSNDQLSASPSIPAASMVGAVAVSWQLTDVTAQANPPTTPSNPPRDQCNQLYQGPATSLGVPVGEFYSWCDVLNLLSDGLAGANGKPTSGLLQSGVVALGTRYQTASGFTQTRFGSGDFDGGAAIRLMGWDKKSGGWTYTSGVQSVP